jgi:hypothetical protein
MNKTETCGRVEVAPDPKIVRRPTDEQRKPAFEAHALDLVMARRPPADQRERVGRIAWAIACGSWPRGPVLPRSRR